MLSCAAHGGVFASPGPSAVLAGLRACGTGHPCEFCTCLITVLSLHMIESHETVHKCSSPIMVANLSLWCF